MRLTFVPCNGVADSFMESKHTTAIPRLTQHRYLSCTEEKALDFPHKKFLLLFRISSILHMLRDQIDWIKLRLNQSLLRYDWYLWYMTRLHFHLWYSKISLFNLKIILCGGVTNNCLWFSKPKEENMHLPLFTSHFILLLH